ncbi:MAG TPA: aldolase/citrate lyase family protein [Bacteroidales bacterium]|nr:aldolase/citrate lyase family protein [Bacteroidales bacterium]
MPLTLMYITNKPKVAKLAERAGVDRLWVDLEYIGKEARQAGLNSVKSNHTLHDVEVIKNSICNSELLVRVNPIHEGSHAEIIGVIERGADVIMLPMFRTSNEVNKFIDIVNGKAKILLLLETIDAEKNIDKILNIDGIDEIHIGLNDLHLEYKKTFMFELLIDGTVERLCHKIREKGYRFGIGGIARVGYGDVPAELILTEHYRLGSQMAILSRSFCDANTVEDVSLVQEIFIDGVNKIRMKEAEISLYTDKEFEINYSLLEEKIKSVVKRKNEKHV